MQKTAPMIPVKRIWTIVPPKKWNNPKRTDEPIIAPMVEPKSVSRVISYSVGHIFGGNGCAQRGSNDDHMCGIQSAEGKKYH